MKTEFWVAAHLTGLFEINDQYDSLLEIGSRGAGFSIQRGVKTSIQKTDKSTVVVHFDDVPQPASRTLITQKTIKLLLPESKQWNFEIHHQFEIPLSSGFGASAAGALGTAFCINEFFNLGLSDLELFQVAHKAEVLTKSGLGDVIGLFQGGLEIRIRGGAPGYGETINMIKNDDWKVATVSLGPLSTSSVLSNPRKREIINRTSSELIANLIKNPDFTTFIHSVKEFTHRVQLCSPQLQTILESLPTQIIGAQIMLGDALFIFYTNSDELSDVQLPFGTIQPEEICEQTVRRLN